MNERPQGRVPGASPPAEPYQHGHRPLVTEFPQEPDRRGPPRAPTIVGLTCQLLRVGCGFRSEWLGDHRCVGVRVCGELFDRPPQQRLIDAAVQTLLVMLKRTKNSLLIDRGGPALIGIDGLRVTRLRFPFLWQSSWMGAGARIHDLF